MKSMVQKHRCGWVSADPLSVKYHDEEWGVPLHDDARMFEFFLLETFQAGLSWMTILKKRAHFREAFDQFDYKKIAKYSDVKIEKLLENPAIIRNKKKIHAAVNNAQAYQEVQKECGTFCEYLWGFVGGVPMQNEWKVFSEVPATTELSDRVARDLKKRGFTFVGSTVIYAHLQATGVVNDHEVGCFRNKEVEFMGVGA